MGIENKNHTQSEVVLLSAKIETPLGPMLVISDDAGLYMLALIVPCHRIINSNGRLGDYAGGIARKQWLLAHENRLTRD